MTATKHTPGPWSYNELSANRVLSPNKQVVAATYGGFVGSGEQEANTRIVAAAPAMYGYVSRKASEGDQDAMALLASIDGD